MTKTDTFPPKIDLSERADTADFILECTIKPFKKSKGGTVVIIGPDKVLLEGKFCQEKWSEKTGQFSSGF